MSKKKPTTSGAEWLEHSLAAFNGSGYADYDNPVAFLESYRDYKQWRKQPQAVELLSRHWIIACEVAKKLLGGSGAGRRPSDKSYAKFVASRSASHQVLNLEARQSHLV